MSFQDYLKENQKIVYQTFASSKESNRISHAYLIKGNEGSPLLETSLFLAKSLICQNANPFACEECMTCIRFDESNYADFKLLNGQERNIKVNDIEALQSFFQNTSTEKNGKMIYIIHLLENSNKEALNALLKFLEEPNENVYAFITTQNEEKLLPTILSRLQHLKLLPIKHNELIKQAQLQGISEDDSELLCEFCGNIDTLVKTATSENYIKIKDLVFDTLDSLIKSKKEGLYFVQHSVIPSIQDKVNMRLFLDILSIAFKDAYNYKIGMTIILKSHQQLIEELSKFSNLENIYKEIILTRGRIELNVNLGLLLEHIFIYIQKGTE